jgi:hypothetical protein
VGPDALVRAGEHSSPGFETIFQHLDFKGSSTEMRSFAPPGRMRHPPLSVRWLDGGGLGAEFIECAFQLGGDVDRFAMFNVAALHHVDELAVAQQRNRR